MLQPNPNQAELYLAYFHLNQETYHPSINFIEPHVKFVYKQMILDPILFNYPT